MHFHQAFLFVTGLLAFLTYMNGTVSDGLVTALYMTLGYGAAVLVVLLWTHWEYVLDEKGVAQQTQAAKHREELFQKHSGRWYSRYAIAAFLILVGIWMWDVKGENWVTRIVSVGYFIWALYMAREVGFLVLAGIGIALVLWIFSALPPIPTAIIVGALIIAAAIRDRR